MNDLPIWLLVCLSASFVLQAVVLLALTVYSRNHGLASREAQRLFRVHIDNLAQREILLDKRYEAICRSLDTLAGISHAPPQPQAPHMPPLPPVSLNHVSHPENLELFDAMPNVRAPSNSVSSYREALRASREGGE